MASNVFGLEITDTIVRFEPEYFNRMSITREDRARVAYKVKDKGSNASEAQKYVENLLEEVSGGANSGIYTPCLLYNATGDTLSYVLAHDWYGHIATSPYPLDIANGQWAGFLHMRDDVDSDKGTLGCVVYGGKNAVEDGYEWMLGWCSTSSKEGAYSMIRKAHGFDKDVDWDAISSKLQSSGRTHNLKWNGCSSTETITPGRHAVFKAVVRLEPNVFGNPITDNTLKRMEKYKDKDSITRLDRAQVALEKKDSDSNKENARKYVEYLQSQDGVQCVFGLVYNATGNTISYALDHPWEGSIGASLWPLEIANGQWGAFLHVGARHREYYFSNACVVYRSSDDYGFEEYNWLLGWCVPYGSTQRAYTEIRQDDYDKLDNWDSIKDEVNQSGLDHQFPYKGFLSQVKIVPGSPSMYEAILTLKNAE